MNIFLNAGFGDPLPLDQCQQIRAMGFDGIRTDALFAGPHGQEPRLISNGTLEETDMHLAAAGLQTQWLISRPLETGPIDVTVAVDRVRWLIGSGFVVAERLPHSFDVGLEGNHSRSPYPIPDLVRLINSCQDAAGDNIPVSATLTNNMGREALRYAKACFNAGLSCNAIGLHPYKTTVKPWEPARGSGWASREEEWSAWQELAARYNVELWAPEWGYHCGVSNVPAPGWMGKLGRKVKLSYSEDQQREFTEYELFDQIERGVKMSGVFQYNDAADAATNQNHEAHYGMRRADGSHKPVVGAIRHVQRVQRGE